MTEWKTHIEGPDYEYGRGVRKVYAGCPSMSYYFSLIVIFIGCYTYKLKSTKSTIVCMRQQQIQSNKSTICYIKAFGVKFLETNNNYLYFALGILW